jgi:hypothetical protein
MNYSKNSLATTSEITIIANYMKKPNSLQFRFWMILNFLIVVLNAVIITAVLFLLWSRLQIWNERSSKQFCINFVVYYQFYAYIGKSATSIALERRNDIMLV